jgi:hypothetical protein
MKNELEKPKRRPKKRQGKHNRWKQLRKRGKGKKHTLMPRKRTRKERKRRMNENDKRRMKM